MYILQEHYIKLCCSVFNCVVRILFVSVLDKEDSCEEMSVPSSPHNEAIQHSSVSTSNGVSSSTAPVAALALGPATGPPADQSTEGEESNGGVAPGTQTQPSGSWSHFRGVTFIPGSHVCVRRKKFSSLSSVWRIFIYVFFFLLTSFSIKYISFKNVHHDARDGTLQIMGNCTDCLILSCALFCVHVYSIYYISAICRCA